MVLKIFLAKKTLTFINGAANLSNNRPRNSPDQIILDNCALLSFISIKMLLVIKFLILVSCLVVTNNS